MKIVFMEHFCAGREGTDRRKSQQLFDIVQVGIMDDKSVHQNIAIELLRWRCQIAADSANARCRVDNIIGSSRFK
jgi:hypothetical protein